MSTARVDYIAPWWTYWLHSFPHVNLRLQPVDSTFRPYEDNYQQSLIFLGCVAAAALGLNLLLLAIYLSCLCCCRKEEEEESKRPNSCCVTWAAVTAGLVCCFVHLPHTASVCCPEPRTCNKQPVAPLLLFPAGPMTFSSAARTDARSCLLHLASKSAIDS